MKKLTIFIAVVNLWLGATGNQAKAEAITYTQSVIATGSLGRTSFTSQLVTLTGTGDTTNVFEFFTNFYFNPTTITVTVAGVGSGTFTDPNVDAFSYKDGTEAGFNDRTTNLDILGTFSAAFGNYDLTTSIAPASGTSSFNDFRSFSTTAGNFEIDSLTNPSTFQAQTGAAVPEVSTYGPVVFAVAFGCILLRRRRANA